MKKEIYKKLGVALICAVLLSTGQLGHAQAVGEAGPDFEVTLDDGNTWKLSDQAGNVVMVFFFGNTCPSCKAAAPSVESDVFKAFMDNPNFKAIGIDTWNSSSSVTSVTAFRNSTNVTFPLAVKGGDVASDYGSTYDRLMVIDGDGVLVHKGQIGAKNDINNVINAINESLVASSVGQESSPEDALRVYPVPAGDRLYIEARESISEIRIFNAAGKEMRSIAYGTAVQGVVSVDLDGLHEGLYFYSVQSGSQRLSGKFLVQ